MHTTAGVLVVISLTEALAKRWSRPLKSSSPTDHIRITPPSYAARLFKAGRIVSGSSPSAPGPRTDGYGPPHRRRVAPQRERPAESLRPAAARARGSERPPPHAQQSRRE